MGVASIVAAGRRLVGTTLLDSAIRQKLTVVSDGQGGQRQSWADVGRKLPARYGQLNEADSAGRNLRDAAGQMEGVPGGVLLLPLGASVAEGDRVRDPATGRRWLVMGEATPPSVVAVVRRLYIREV